MDQNSKIELIKLDQDEFSFVEPQSFKPINMGPGKKPLIPIDTSLLPPNVDLEKYLEYVRQTGMLVYNSQANVPSGSQQPADPDKQIQGIIIAKARRAGQTFTAQKLADLGAKIHEYMDAKINNDKKKLLKLLNEEFENSIDALEEFIQNKS